MLPPEFVDRPLPPDNHVHTEWSWDASTGSMEGSCRRAMELGLPSIAFTDHADFTDWAFPGQADETPALRVVDEHSHGGFLDVQGYMDCLERCRDMFPDLTILSGVELGEPHLFDTQVDSMLSSWSFDRVLGSLHSLTDDEGVLVYAPTLLKKDTVSTMRRYFAATLKMIETTDSFAVLAHIDYPMRAPWPPDAKPYDALDYEEEYRAVLRALARSGRALEVNTSGPWPAHQVIGWWYEEGGQAVSFGSDAHEPGEVAQRFMDAAALVESCGFRPGRRPTDFWRR
ncbi:PHP domain-containing protein [Actinomadura sp. 6N118]|uniref:PHP domain-containing protein n=1 Tax=Actinomadura sp. 6N118 TaxID=3375151 RepID=UPI00379D8779